MCKHVVYTTIVNFQMNIVYRRKIKNKKNNKKTVVVKDSSLVSVNLRREKRF